MNKKRTKYEDDLNTYIGQKFNDWLVIDIGELKPYINSGRKYYHKTLKCKCECDYCNGVVRDIPYYNVVGNKTLSCGKQFKFQSKKNEYNLNGEYGIGYTFKGEKFYFDLDDYELIKDYCWFYSGGGYPIARVKGTDTKILLHNLVMNVDPCKIDHINRIRHDCRKENLRFMNRSQNASNISIRKDNTSGFIGVYWSKEENKWFSLIQYNRKSHHLGYYTDKEDAIKARLRAEKEFMREFAPQRHLFKQYEIN